MKKIYIICMILCVSLLPGCGYNDNSNTSDDKQKAIINEKENNVKNEASIIIDGKEYVIKLENNDTVEELINTLPMTMKMSELNGNEKYYYMDDSLPTNAIKPKSIEAGDVMLYGDNCLVIFYKSFNTSYSYTKIGHIDNLPDLGSASIDVEIK